MVEVQLAKQRAATPTTASFSSVIEKELAGAYRLAGYILGDAVEAQDAVQESLERAWRG
jgi:DNA-directed RNA polymerase specialized sigma24 family protein